ncbi:rab9 effector protein with kelch motifs-like [Ranitomeya imitator]|uniref:rab9 effector protein with kelch motifs-like n=1 Tax=Ranitomeya imitator TaxID=111125 RepID=UPI0037E75959
MALLPELYVLCDPQKPPVRLQRLSSCPNFTATLAFPIPSQMLVFSVGDWSGLSRDGKVEVQLEVSGQEVERIGTLTHESRCFLWDCASGDYKGNKSGKGEFSVSMVLHGQVSVKAKSHPNHECKKRKRLKEDMEENICPNKESVKGPVIQQKAKAGKDGALAKAGKDGVLAKAGKDGALTKVTPGKGKRTISGGPTERWGHALCPADSQTVILIGGQGTRMLFCKDSMWKLNTADKTWSPVEALADHSSPEARTGHTAVFDPESQRIYVFGGSKNKKWFNDVHILDTVTWRWRSVESKGKVPPLSYHSCSQFLGELFVFGGVFPRPHPIPDGCSDSLYIFDPQHEIWYKPIVQGDKPAARSGHSACLLDRELYIFAGWDAPVIFNDLYVLDLGIMEFSRVEVEGNSPTPRTWHSAACVSSSRFLIHGGFDGNQTLNDTCIFNTVTKTWTTLVHDSLPSSPRAGSSMLSLPGVKGDGEDCSSSELLIFGGGDNNGHFYNDTIRLQKSDILDY